MARCARGVLYGGVQEKCPGNHIIITTQIFVIFCRSKVSNLFHKKKAKLLANRTSQGNFLLLPLLPPSSLERFFFLAHFFLFSLHHVFPLRGVRAAFISFHFGLFGLRLNRHFHRELPVNIC